MAAIDEIRQELIQKSRASGPKPGDAEKPVRPEKAKKIQTPEEREAYRQKMIAREEARMLAKAGQAQEKASGKPTASKAKAKKPSAKKPTARKSKRRKPSRETSRATVRTPKAIGPLEPLYILQIPGLPKGDRIVVCYAKGAGE